MKFGHVENIENIDFKLPADHANTIKTLKRLDDWIDRLKIWVDHGLRDIYFFVHRNIEMESPLLSAYLIKKLNKEFGLTLHIPEIH